MQTQETRLSRREVIRFFGAVTAAMAVGKIPTSGQNFAPPAATPLGKGYGPDPDMTKFYKPGDVWPLTFTEGQRKTASALADAIFPADDLGPAATALRVPDYIDEWVSAPYPQQQGDRPVIIEGIAWIEAQAQTRFQKDFASLTPQQQQAICDEICWPADAKPEAKQAAQFFSLFRSLASGAYYGTPEGWKAVGYVGNIPLVSFDGPPAEVLQKLGVEQTVK